MIPPEASLLTLYLNASRRWRGKPLYRAVVEEARALPAAGAAVFLVDLSFGAQHQLRDAKSEYTFVDIPVILEFVDAPERIDELLARLTPMIVGGLATVEPVRVARYAHHSETVGASAEDRLTTLKEGATRMSIEGDVQKITVYIGSSDVWEGGNLAMAIIERCRRMGLAGATASLGVLGFGKHSVIHRSHLFGLSASLPEKIEIIDEPGRIAEILPILEEMVDGGLIVVQDLRAIHHAHHSTPPGS